MGRKGVGFADVYEEGAPTSGSVPQGQEQTRPALSGHPYGIFWLLPAFNLGVLALELAYQVNTHPRSAGCKICISGVHV